MKCILVMRTVELLAKEYQRRDQDQHSDRQVQHQRMHPAGDLKQWRQCYPVFDKQQKHHQHLNAEDGVRNNAKESIHVTYDGR